MGHDVVDSAIEAKGRSDDDTKTTDVFSASLRAPNVRFLWRVIWLPAPLNN